MTTAHTWSAGAADGTFQKEQAAKTEGWMSEAAGASFTSRNTADFLPAQSQEVIICPSPPLFPVKQVMCVNQKSAEGKS